jgi:hypothetical protein
MRFQSSLSENGMTGWKFRKKRVFSSGPTPYSQLAWKGTLIRLATGFDNCLARSWVPLPGGGAAGAWARSGVAASASAAATTWRRVFLTHSPFRLLLG